MFCDKYRYPVQNMWQNIYVTHILQGLCERVFTTVVWKPFDFCQNTVFVTLSRLNNNSVSFSVRHVSPLF